MRGRRTGGGLFCEHLDVYLETWPTSGMTRGGVAYELPTLAPPTTGSASSSSHGLPTPRATRDGSSTETAVLLKTPTSNLGMNHGAQHPDKRRQGGPNQRGSSGDLMLPSAVHHLLPTPTAADSTASGGSAPSNVTLTDAAVRTDMGRAANPRHGAHTHQPSPAGNPSWGVQRQRRQSQHREAGDD